MSRIKLNPDLFLGVPEFKKLIKSIRVDSILNINRSITRDFGVVVHEKLPNSLRVVPSNDGKISIKPGIAVDRDYNFITINKELTNISIPNDNQKYFITIYYDSTHLEEGTVDISPDGTLVGHGTKFTELFRGESSKLPTRIKFFSDNLGTVSYPPILTQEFEISSVQTDELAYLNIPSGVLSTLKGLRFGIVGTFTPSVVVDDDKKFPFINDSYRILITKNDRSDRLSYFTLGTAINNNGVVSVTDTRGHNTFSISDTFISLDNFIVGVEAVKSKGSGEGSLVEIGWGIKSPKDTYTIEGNGQLVVMSGQGGIVDDLLDYDDDTLGQLIGWRVLFPDGTIGKIIDLQSNEDTYDVRFTITKSGKINGDLYIIPDCDSIEFSILSQPHNTEIKRLSFDTNMRSGIIEVESESQIKILYRHSKSTIGAGILIGINNGNYLFEDSFDEFGRRIKFAWDTVSDSILNVRKNRFEVSQVTEDTIQLPVGGIIEWVGEESDIPPNFVVCDGRVINDKKSKLFGKSTPNYKQCVSVGYDVDDPDFANVGSKGGSNVHTLKKSELPNDKYTIVTSSNGKHSHKFPGDDELGNWATSLNWIDYDADSGGGNGRMYLTSEEPPHSHTVEFRLGEGESFSLLSRHIIVYKIMRIW